MDASSPEFPGISAILEGGPATLAPDGEPGVRMGGPGEPGEPGTATGTPEALWQAWEALGRLRRYPLTGFDRVLVVAAHPGDELLGVGGGLAALAAGGARPRIVQVGDGDALADEGLRRIGLDPDADVQRLGLPRSAPGEYEDELTDILARRMPGFEVCLAPWTGDVHADHEAVGRAAVVAGARCGVPVVHYPIWMWHWAEPADIQVPWYLAARVELPAWAHAAKLDALCLREGPAAGPGPDPDDAPVHDGRGLDCFRRPYEVLFA